MQYNDTYTWLSKRGFIAQCSDPSEAKKLFEEKKAIIYWGIDPTGGSMHVGHMLPLRLLLHLGRSGQKVIVLIGEGTTHIGDPSGKTDTRKILSSDVIKTQSQKIREQIQGLLSSLENCEILNNADWLLPLNYIDFLRDVGSYFSVNRMLSFESYKQRMKKGLSFLEFNYQVLQSYDYLHLSQTHNCNLQIGGDDQWGNIVSGMNLIRRKQQKPAYALTAPLLVTSRGMKMGKTEKGAIYLDPNMCSVFDFYQYWRNVSDTDLPTFLSLFTDRSSEEISELTAEEGSALNPAKQILAHDVTAFVHGEEKAKKIHETLGDLFEKNSPLNAKLPEIHVQRIYLTKKPPIPEFCGDFNIFPSRSKARQIILQKGLRLNGEIIKDVNVCLSESDFTNKSGILQIGKKRFFRLLLDD